MFAVITGCIAFTACSDKEDSLVQGSVSIDVAAATAPDDAQVRAAAIVLTGKGGTVTVPVTAGLPDGFAPQYTVTASENSAWCQATVSSSILTIVVEKSSETSGRIATLEIAATATGAEIRPLTLSVQQGEKVIPTGDITVNAEEIEIPEDANYTNGVVEMSYIGGKAVLPITNTLEEPVEVEYSIDDAKPLPAWCTAQLVDGKLIIEAEPTATPTVEQAEIIIKATGKTETVNLMAATIKVNQAPFVSAQTMVFVKGGTYTMGAGQVWKTDINWETYEESEPYLVDAQNYYKYPVTVDGFYIATTEVTHKLYESVMGTNPVTKDFVGDNYPVVNITWPMACEFCNKLSEKEGLTPAYVEGDIIEIPDPWGWGPGSKMQDYIIVEGANGYRLATSAEWEFAARGGNEGANAELTAYAGGNDADEVMWYDKNSKVNNKNVAHEVAILKANILGLYDMSGNAAEWVYDWGTKYSDRDQRKAITEAVNPIGPDWTSGQDEKVARGGSYADYDSKCYVHAETNTTADDTSIAVRMGIRLVRSAK